MVRAFSTLGCPESDLRSAVALAKRFRIDGLELRALADTVNLPTYFASEHGSPEGFGAAMQDQLVPVVALDTSLHLAEAKGPDREQFLAFIPWAEAAGVRWLRVFDGGAKMGERAAIAAAAATVHWWREVRSDGNLRVDVMVETHNRFFTAATVKRFLHAAPDTAILWDAHHTWRQGNEDPVTTWHEIGAHVVHIHVKDSIPVATSTHPYKYVLPGAGEFPMAPLRDALAADKFAGTLSLEWERLWHPELPPLDEALKFAAEHRWW
ncbi:MAG TPA: TIM barrel protein [Opitutaceae bacterium]|nr:TIM barrel protein [Opitutaceae bacterium]